MSNYNPPPSKNMNFCQSPVFVNPMDLLIAEAKKAHGVVLPEDVKQRLRETYNLWVGFYKRTQTTFFKQFTDFKSVKFKAFGESL